jgi:hypothetical protein
MAAEARCHVHDIRRHDPSVAECAGACAALGFAPAFRFATALGLPTPFRLSSSLRLSTALGFPAAFGFAAPLRFSPHRHLSRRHEGVLQAFTLHPAALRAPGTTRLALVLLVHHVSCRCSTDPRRTAAAFATAPARRAACRA